MTSIVGLDTAKNVFQVHGVDGKGNMTIRKRLRRAQVSEFFAIFPVVLSGWKRRKARTIGRVFWRPLGTRCG